MFKCIKMAISAVGLVVLLAVGGWFYLQWQIAGQITSGITTLGPQYVGSAVTVEGASISLLTGTGEVRGLTIGNPAGYDAPRAMKFERITFKLDVMSLRSDKILLSNLTLEQPEVWYQFTANKGSNIDAIREHLLTALPRNGTAAGAPGATGRKAKVDTFTVNGGTIHVIHPSLQAQNKEMVLPMAALTVKDIGNDADGATTAEVVSQIGTPFLDSLKNEVAARTNFTSTAGRIIEAVKDKAGNLIDGVKSIFKRDN